MTLLILPRNPGLGPAAKSLETFKRIGRNKESNDLKENAKMSFQRVFHKFDEDDRCRKYSD